MIDIFYDPKQYGLVLTVDYKGEKIRVYGNKLVDVEMVSRMNNELQKKMIAVDEKKDKEIIANILIELSNLKENLATSKTKRQTIKYYNETGEKIREMMKW